MHLLLSTQTISNAVSQDLSDNTTLSICLRVKNDAESRAVIGIPDAARLPPCALGRGYLTSGEPARTFQSGWVGARTSPQQEELDVVVEQFQIGGLRERGGSAGASTGLPSDLERVIAATWDAVKLGGLRPASPIGDAPLPVLVRVDELPPQPVGAQTLPLLLALGLLDEPTRRRQVTWTLNLGVHGHLVVVGGTRSGRSTLLRTLAAVASSEDGSPTPHIYVIDGAARQLTCLAALPNVGAVVPGDDDERLLRLLAVLQREVARRQGEPAPEPDLPPILVLVDRFESLHDDSFAVHGPDLGSTRK